MITEKHHYHGKTIRGLYIALAISLLLTAPWQIKVEVFHVQPLVGLIISIFLAGLLSRRHVYMYYVSALTAIVFLVYFQYLTYKYFDDEQVVLAIITQANMILMVLAAYCSIRTTYAWEGPLKHSIADDFRPKD